VVLVESDLIHGCNGDNKYTCASDAGSGGRVNITALDRYNEKVTGPPHLHLPTVNVTGANGEAVARNNRPFGIHKEGRLAGVTGR